MTRRAVRCVVFRIELIVNFITVNVHAAVRKRLIGFNHVGFTS